MGPLDRNPAYVAGFLLLLVVPQAAALVEQVQAGYRLFLHAPGRVPLSWDMFATAITRCDVSWDPPLALGERRFGRLRDAGRAFEWDPVYDTVADYTLAAHYGCGRAVGPTTAFLRCFTFEGEKIEHAFRCR